LAFKKVEWKYYCGVMSHFLTLQGQLMGVLNALSGLGVLSALSG
jgi:hypothetical protein